MENEVNVVAVQWEVSFSVHRPGFGCRSKGKGGGRACLGLRVKCWWQVSAGAARDDGFFLWLLCLRRCRVPTSASHLLNRPCSVLNPSTFHYSLTPTDGRCESSTCSLHSES